MGGRIPKASAARKTATPATKAGFRPSRSDTLPKMGMETACISRNDENTQE